MTLIDDALHLMVTKCSADKISLSNALPSTSEGIKLKLKSPFQFFFLVQS